MKEIKKRYIFLVILLVLIYSILALFTNSTPVEKTNSIIPSLDNTFLSIHVIILGIFSLFSYCIICTFINKKSKVEKEKNQNDYLT
jgi:uncharacterized protein YpmB